MNLQELVEEKVWDDPCICDGSIHHLTTSCLGKKFLTGEYIYKTPFLGFFWRIQRLISGVK